VTQVTDQRSVPPLTALLSVLQTLPESSIAGKGSAAVTHLVRVRVSPSGPSRISGDSCTPDGNCVTPAAVTENSQLPDLIVSSALAEDVATTAKTKIEPAIERTAISAHPTRRSASRGACHENTPSSEPIPAPIGAGAGGDRHGGVAGQWVEAGAGGLMAVSLIINPPKLTTLPSATTHRGRFFGRASPHHKRRATTAFTTALKTAKASSRHGNHHQPEPSVIMFVKRSLREGHGLNRAKKAFRALRRYIRSAILSKIGQHGFRTGLEQS